ncbi:COG2958 family protein [Loktanella agnita]|uniref:COG2958 family protein n=1 Tax=Loktanella agnita TaxID=287097 RepID=UPI0039870386
MTNFSITKFVPEYLRANPDVRFTARQIAIWIMETHPEAVENKRKKSAARKTPLDTDDAMLQQIVAEIGAQRKGLEGRHAIRTTEGRPRKFFYSDKSELEEVAENAVSDLIGNEQTQGVKHSEHDLYPLFRDYLHNEHQVICKRIDERKSSNNRGSNGNRWLFPDIVGMEDLSQHWDREVIDCAKEYSDKKTKLWSFELKLKVNSTNLRETFFQAVSNSSWANLGYLVAVEFQGSETLGELRLLSGLHGIGVMRFDPEDFSSSEILIPSRERAEIDWGTVNRIVQQNPDFKDYVSLVRQFYQTGNLKPSEWH